MRLADRFAAFKKINAPDLWGDVIAREPVESSPDRPPSRRKKIVAAATAFAVAAGLFAVLTHTFGGKPASGPGAPSSHPNTVSALGGNGRYRCTAQFPSSTITPGMTTGVRVTVTNLSSKDLDVPEGAGNGVAASLTERTPGGTLLQDTIHMHDGIIGGMPSPHLVKPGETMDLPVDDAPILWSGPIETTVSCPIQYRAILRLEPFTLHVVAPGEAPSPEDSIARAVAATSPTFDRCAPRFPHTPVTGVVVGGDESNPTDVGARCEVVVIQRSGFDTVVLGAFCPPGGAAYPLASLANVVTSVPFLKLTPPDELMWRTVVVTSDTALVAKGGSVSVGKNSYGSGNFFTPC